MLISTILMRTCSAPSTSSIRDVVVIDNCPGRSGGGSANGGAAPASGSGSNSGRDSDCVDGVAEWGGDCGPELEIIGNFVFTRSQK